MKAHRTALLAAALALLASPVVAQDAPTWSLAIHGGAGVIERDSLTPEQDAAYRAALHRALQAGQAILAADGSSMDAVQAAIEMQQQMDALRQQLEEAVNQPDAAPANDQPTEDN